jgi:hypothetical protein
MNLSRAVSLLRIPALNRSLLILPICLLAAGSPLFAQGTKLWTQSRYEELEKGTPQGVEIRSDGKLRSGPVSKDLFTSPSSFVWSVAAGKDGTAYLATGSPASVLRVTGDGKSQTLFETKALAVQVLRVGPDGMLYAATLPDGKIYRLKPDAAKTADEASAEVVFDLSKFDADSAEAKKADDKSGDGTDSKKADKSRYIWDMTFDSAGRLYVATGGPGAVYRVDVKQAQPKAEVFFKTDEQHIRALAWDKAGNLIAGSDGSGLVYRIDKNGKGYVLFSAPRREITALAIDADGTIFASDVGDKSRNPLPVLPVQSGASSITISFAQPGSVQAANASASLPDGSEIFALKADQAPRKVWSGKDEIVYSLTATPEGLVALTGNRGRILRINTADGSFGDIAHLEAQQAVSMAATPAGWLVGTANTGKLYSIGASTGSHSYASDVLDAGATARWGRVEVAPDSKNYQLFTRSGNVEQPVRSAKDWGWSDWQPLADGKVVSPVGRYLQWKVELQDGGEASSVGVNFLAVNAAPAVDDLVVVPGARVIPQLVQATPPTVQIALPTAAANAGVSFEAANAAQPIQGQKDRTAVTVRWAAHDDNGDDLSFDLFIRGDGEKLWRPLKKNLTDKVYSFDATSLPDGGYQVKVVASDAPSHTPGEVLTGEQVSDRFEIDTTAPVVSGLKGVSSDGRIQVSLDAADAASPIAHAEYSLDAGPWQYIEPVGGLSDSKLEHYLFSAPLPSEAKGEAEHVITVRVYDRHENVATAKTLVPAK